jgi:hypothetical protein
MHLNHHDSSKGNFGWTTSWPSHCDYMILGLFTGYRTGEYGQTNNCSYGNCAMSAHGDGSSEFAGTPLAACHPNFLFFDLFSNTVPYSNKLNCIRFVDIRFRLQKSLRHGQFRTLKALPNDPLCPVVMSRRTLLRADALCIPPWTPVSLFRIPETGAAMYVKRITF